MSAEQLPDGFELSLTYYATSSEGLNASITLGGKTKNEAVHDVPGLVAAVAETLRGLETQSGGTWRPMTREEIAEYKEENA